MEKDKLQKPGDKIVLASRKPRECVWHWKDAFEPGELNRQLIIIFICSIVTVITGLMLIGVINVN